jgi:glyceraldehyde-3-phosphate dehydrogenase/erythrose-4-phosphate dehydrogenase
MGYIKEPAGIDFVVDSTPLTIEDRKKISEIISYYKATGRKKILATTAARTQMKTKFKKVVA